MDADVRRDPKVQRLAELIGEIRIAILTTIAADGSLHARPVTIRGRGFDGNLWFVTRRDSGKTAELRAHAQVSLGFARMQDNTYVCVSGTAALVEDSAKAEQLWVEDYRGWFPGGPSDPNLGLIRIHVDRAEYWDAPPTAWAVDAAFIVTAPEQWNDPAYHARVVLEGD